MSAIDVLAAALYAACLRDLPDIEWAEVNHADERRHLDSLEHGQRGRYYKEKAALNTAAAREAFFAARGIAVLRQRARPIPDACEVTMFRQTWGSTALGYGGIAGQALTDAQTIIVRCDQTGWAAVYFGGSRLAYLVPPEKQGETWCRLVAEQRLPSCRDAQDDLGINDRLASPPPFLFQEST